MFKFLLIFFFNLYATDGFSSIDNTRIKMICRKIKCPVCNGQAIDESFVRVAVGLRQEVIDKVTFGYTNKEIIDLFFYKYGLDIVFEPKLKLSTYIVWFLPWIFLVLAIIKIFFLYIKNWLK